MATSEEVRALRRDVGAQMRAFAHSFVGHDADAGMLEEVATTVSDWNRRLDAAPVQTRSVDDYLDDLGGSPNDGGEQTHFDDCPVCGHSNPLAIRVPAWRQGDGTLAKVRLGPAHQGVPGRSHGGVVAALFDDTMGFVVASIGVPAFQFELTVRYLKPTPIGPELEVRAWPVERSGRRFVVDANIMADGVETATARGVHIVVDAQHVAAAAAAAGAT